MTCMRSCGRCLLMIFNLLTLLIGMAIIALGVILKFFPGVIMKFMFEGLRATVPFTLPTGTNDLDIVPLMDEIGLVLIILGAVLFGVAFFACCGACCRWNFLLGVFCVCLIFVMIAIATVGSLIMIKDSPLHKNMKTGLRKKVHDEYKGPRSGDVFSLAINTISYSMNCCAVMGPEDFDGHASWTLFTASGNSFKISASPACCTQDYLYDNRIQECTQKPFLSSRIYTQGCYMKLLDRVQEQRTWVIIGIVGVILFLFLEMLLTVFLIRDIKRSDSHAI